MSPRDFSGLSFTLRQSKSYPKNKCWTQFTCECSSFALCFMRTNDANARYHFRGQIHTSSGCSPSALHLQEIETCFLSKLSTIGETLTVLRLDGLEIFASNLQAIGDSCKNLVEIGLSKCNGVTDDGITSLIVNCGYLRTIDVTCCHLLTNDALAAIAKNCRMVECLRLESCPFINEKGLERIGTLCSNLKEIDLTDCRINDEGN